jgi:8-oxo-dGTP diphosphatase
MWEFPGGKLLQGETLGEAAKRELAEELALELTAMHRYLGRQRDPGSVFELHFVEVSAHGEATPLEHSEVVWAERGDLDGFLLAPGDRAFLDRLTRAG